MKILLRAFSWREVNSSHRLMLFGIVVLGLLNFFWGDKVPSNNGLGWDGVNYAEMVRNLGSMVGDRQLSGYYTQRILPSSIVRGMLLLAGAPINNENIIRGFEIYNLLLLAGACWVWKKIADAVGLSLRGRWIGFVGLFLSYQCSKQTFFYPVLTDTTAFFVAMLQLRFYVEKRPLALLFTTLVGAFCWPIISICGALLLLFMNVVLPDDVVKPTASDRSRRMVRLVKRGCLALVAFSVVGCIILAVIGPQPRTPVNMPAFVALAHPEFVARWTLWRIHIRSEQLLTALPSLVVAFFALGMMVGSPKFIPAVLVCLRKAKPFHVVLAVLAILVPILIVKAVSNPGIANAGSLKALIHAAIVPEYEGMIFLPFVSLAVFLGPVLLLSFLHWKAICIEARKLGLGVMAIIGVGILFGVVGEPRFVITAWPFFVLTSVMAFEKMRLPASFNYALGVLTILFAQFWMTFNLTPWPEPLREGALRDYPQQLYFMHYGLWMAWWPYVIQFTALVLGAIWLRRSERQVGVAACGGRES